MSASIADASRSILLVVDMQPSFLKVIHETDRILSRCEFLIRMANLLDIPVIATEQNPERMHGTSERLMPLLDTPPISKMTFSCVGCEAFDQALKATSNPKSDIRNPKPNQAILVGIETHICVTQTALHLLEQGYQVKVCEDAASARAKEMNEIGFRRLRHAGVDVAHTESIAYEWLRRADSPKFREALQIVKQFS
ncbi:MAG: isochorismatase family protein [Fimbriimonadaceae bacterium]